MPLAAAGDGAGPSSCCPAVGSTVLCQGGFLQRWSQEAEAEPGAGSWDRTALEQTCAPPVLLKSCCPSGYWRWRWLEHREGIINLSDEPPRGESPLGVPSQTPGQCWCLPGVNPPWGRSWELLPAPAAIAA